MSKLKVVKNLWIGAHDGDIKLWIGKTKPRWIEVQRRSAYRPGGTYTEKTWSRYPAWAFCRAGFGRAIGATRLKSGEVKRVRLTIEEISE